ncbi:hypothetical protein [Methylomicrobium album]|uniref:RiboL-PSP-HEPN domain-containing protein n=1 Tax=Methylomicrobium album BG8 TaxID=686340 RepID=H8GP29_METAL|nr:hypothetical protein [Methylomicrobium album]EIC28451.1 hypothetical protein Metal_0606 [Methylomicrobium album BG8]
MSYDESDALRDQEITYLYEQFEMQYESEFIYKRIEKFYESNREIVKAPLQNLLDSKTLFENEYYTSAFIHAVISIEVGIKSVILKPILYSLTIDDKAGNLLYTQTFKNKSLGYIDPLYYQILEEITELNFKTKIRDNNQLTIWNEWFELQKLRNDVLHQGISIEKLDAEKAINMASYVCDEIIPYVLDKFLNHIENGVIKDGSREYTLRREKLKNNNA